MHHEQPTIGSLFAGIGGFDLGFERAGFKTAWQVEIDPLNRAVLADRFPSARRFADIRDFRPTRADAVDVVAGGFPCQDISNSGLSRKAGRLGLNGERSGLFYEAMRVVSEIRPQWVVLENVAALIFSNEGRDMARVLATFRELGYVGLWRTLDAQHFGSPCRRRRVFVVAGHRPPPMELLSDAGPMEAIPSAMPALRKPRPADTWAGYTLQALNTEARITLGGELLVAESDGWDQMAERARKSERNGLRVGLGAADLAERKSAGNAVDPRVAEWIARKLINHC